MNKSWAKKPATMVEKVAKVRALREAFTDEFSGMNEAPEDVEPPIVVEASPEPEQSEEPRQGDGDKKRMSLDDIK